MKRGRDSSVDTERNDHAKRASNDNVVPHHKSSSLPFDEVHLLMDASEQNDECDAAKSSEDDRHFKQP